MGDIPELRKAFEIANEANLAPDELEDLEKREMFIQDQRGAMTKATRIGMEQGIEQGIKQGIKQGIEQGVEQGIEQGKQQFQQFIVSLLESRLGPLWPEIKTRISQLSAEQLDNLGKSIFELASVSDLTDRLQTYSR